MEELRSLISRAQAGRRDAYDIIVCRFQDMATGYAYSFLGDFHLAEDVAQEAFIQAYLSLSDLRIPEAFPGWLRKIVFSHCHRLLRGRRIQTIPLESTTEIPSAEKTPVEHLEEQQIMDDVRGAIQHLSEQERTVLLLFYISEFSHKEIASFLEVPISTVNNRLYSSRKRLREELMKMTKDNLHDQRPSRNEVFVDRVGEHLEALKIFHDQLVPPLANRFSKKLDAEVGVEVLSAHHTICIEVMQNFPNPCFIYSFVPKPGKKRVFIGIGMELAGALMGRHLASGALISTADLAEMIEEEIPQLNLLAGDILRDLTGIWESVEKMELSHPQLDTNPIAMLANPQFQIIRPEEPVFHVLFEVKWGDHSSQINLCYPVDSLASAIPRLQGV